MFLEVLDTHLVKVQGGGYFFWRRLSERAKRLTGLSVGWMELLAATNRWLWAGGARGMCHLPPGTENRCVPGLWGGGDCSAYYGINRAEGGIKGGNGRRCGGGGGGAGWDKHPGGILGGGVRRDKHAGGIPGGEGGANTMAASPRGGGGGANTLVQPHYPNPTKSVNPAGARGGKARDNNQGETGGGDSKEM